MTENMLKNELIQKKKSWKLYVATLGIILIGTGTGLGVYYGLHSYHSTSNTPTNLNILKLNTQISGTANTTDTEFFQTFLDENKNIFGDNLKLNQVELSNFQGINIGQNGALTIAIKKGIKSKFTGSIDITLKYVLNDTTIISMMKYLSQNNMLNFQVPAYTLQTDLPTLITEEFRNTMGNFYLYADNIKNVNISSPLYMPTQEQLNTPGTVWTPPTYTSGTNKGLSLLYLGFTIYYKDGTISRPNEGSAPGSSRLIAWNLNATIKVVDNTIN